MPADERRVREESFRRPGATLALYDVELLGRKVGICPDGRVDENLADDDLVFVRLADGGDEHQPAETLNSCCMHPTRTLIAKTHAGPMRCGHLAQV